MSILFDNVEGIEKGASVKLHGIVVGKVKNMLLLKNSVLVNIEFEKEQKIPVGSKILIINTLIGNASIIIEQSDQTIFFKPTDTIKGSYPAKGILDTFLSDSLNREKVKKAFDTITIKLDQLIEAKRTVQ